MWHGDRLFAHSFRRVLPHSIMVHQHWELSRRWQTEMNLDVAIWSGISFNRLHFMVMRPVPRRSMCTYPLSLTHALPRTRTHNRKQTHTRPLSSRLYPSLSLLHRLLLCLSLVASSQYYTVVFAFRSPPVSPLWWDLEAPWVMCLFALTLRSQMG